MKSHKRYARVQPKRSKKKLLLILLAAVLLITTSVAALELTNKINLFSKPTNKTADTPKIDENGVNYSPPTEEEKQSGNQQKEEIVQKEDKQATPPSTPSNRKAVDPFIVSASAIGGQIDVRGYIEGIAEDGGVCTAHFIKANSAPVEKKTPGSVDWKKTTCQPFIFPQSELSGGGAGWSVTISYLSKTAEGTSEAIPVTVQ